MRSRSLKLPKLCVHKASGQAYVWIQGKRLYLGPAGSAASGAEYARILGRLSADDADDARPQTALRGSKDLTINELILAYRRHAEAYYVKNGQPTTTLPHLRNLLERLSDLFGQVLVSEFSPSCLKTFRQSLVDANRVRRKINGDMSLIRQMFKWGIENELVHPVVLQGLQAVAPLKYGRTSAPESKPVMPVADPAIEAVRPFVARQIWAMIQLQRLTGMRPGEVVIMRGCDLLTSGPIWEYRPARHKTEHHGRDRLVLIGPAAQAILRDWMRANPTDNLFQPIEAEQERRLRLHALRRTPLKHGNRPGNNRKDAPRWQPSDRYTTQSYGRAIAYACRKAGIAVWAPNQLRHAAATHIRKHHGIEAAQVLLGHATADVTEIYAEADVERARAVIGKIG